jgi:hypothetical protein
MRSNPRTLTPFWNPISVFSEPIRYLQDMIVRSTMAKQILKRVLEDMPDFIAGPLIAAKVMHPKAQSLTWPPT